MKILFALSFFYFAAIGWGRLLAWVTCSRKARLNNEIEIYHLFSWLGLPAIFIVASTYNWFLPISINFSRAILLTGLVSFAHYLAQHWKKLSFQDGLIFVTSLAAGYWVQGNESLFYDSLLYHIPVILWHQSEPVVLGLANLHDRFGFNSAWLTISSTFYFPGLGIRAVFIGQALLLMQLVGFVLKQITSTKTASLRLCFFLLATLMVLLLGDGSLKATMTVATSTDAPAMFLVIMSGLLFVSLVDRLYSADQNKTKPLIELLALCTISGLAIMTKLSAAPLAIFIIAFLIFGKASPDLPKVSFGIGGCLTILSVLWIAKNFALTGCLAYPVSFTCTSAVDWAIGADSARLMSKTVLDFARPLGTHWQASPGNLSLIQDGFARHHDFFLALLRSTIIVIAFAVSIRFFKPYFQEKLTHQLSFNNNYRIFYWIPLLVCFAGLALWATSAPDPRFAIGFLVLLPSSIAYPLLPKEHVTEINKQTHPKRIFIYVFLVLIVVLRLFKVDPPRPDNLEKEFSDTNLSRTTVMKTTHSGVSIWVTTNGENRCGTAPLPCTPYFSDALSRESFLWLSLWKIQK